ncbi:MAG: phage terminase large subunit family protein, partial [Fusobacterium sp.]
MEQKTIDLFSNMLKILKPSPDLTIGEWADKYRILSKENSSEPGQWDTNRTPYMKEIYNCLVDSHTESVTMMCSAQVGKTEMLLNILGRYMHLDPCPMLFVQPTVEDAKGFSKERVEPMIRDTKVLKRLVKKSNKRAEGTVQGKMFPGGYVRFVGANSPSGLASRPIRITLLDEIDRFPGSAKEEGNPVELAEARTTTFFNRKMLRVSTPTDDTTSKIKKLFLQGSQEEWCLPCPHCGELQTPKWEYIHDDEGIIKMECQHCGSLEREELLKKN